MKPLVVMLSVSLAALALSGGAWAAGSQRIEPAWIGAAHTAADHEALAKKYEKEASSLENKAEMHKNLAQAYTQANEAALAKHCENIAANLTKTAEEERAMVAAHRKMAGEAGQ